MIPLVTVPKSRIDYASDCCSFYHVASQGRDYVASQGRDYVYELESYTRTNMYTRTGDTACKIECTATGGELICSWRRGGVRDTNYYVLVFSTQLILMGYSHRTHRGIWLSQMQHMRESTNVRVKISKRPHDRLVIKWYSLVRCRLNCVRVCERNYVPVYSNIKFDVVGCTLCTRLPIADMLALPEFKRLPLKLLMVAEWLLPEVTHHMLELAYLAMMSDPASYCAEVKNSFFDD